MIGPDWVAGEARGASSQPRPSKVTRYQIAGIDGYLFDLDMMDTYFV